MTTNDPEKSVDDVTELLADASDALLQDFDPVAARRRFDRLRRRHISLARGGAVAIGGMGLSLWLLPPWLARATGNPGLIDGGRIALGVVIVFALGAAAWWLVTTRRFASALANGPPAMRTVSDDLVAQAGRWNRIIALCGLVAGSAALAVAIGNAGGTPWWFTLWIGLGGLLLLVDAVRRSVGLIREDRAANASRRIGGQE